MLSALYQFCYDTPESVFVINNYFNRKNKTVPSAAQMASNGTVYYTEKHEV